MGAIGEAALAFLVSAGGCLLGGRVAIRALIRAKCVAPARYEACPPLLAHHQGKPETPTMGGIVVLGIGGLIACAAGGLAAREGWIILGAMTALAAVGLFDDALKFRPQRDAGMRSGPKLLAALAVGAAVGWATAADASAAGAVDVPWMGRTIELGWLWVPLAALVVGGSTHAVNLTDGMDGLAAGCVAVAFVVLGLLAVEGPPGIRSAVPWCASLSGACVGFLWFNSAPASVYLGDVGAMGLGAALGTIALVTHRPLLLVVIGGIFVVEAVSVILQVGSYKLRGRRRIFRVAPLHHHFHLGGISEPKLMVRFWIVAMLLGMAALTTSRR